METKMSFVPVGSSKKRNKIPRLIQFVLNYFYCCQSDTDIIPMTFVLSPAAERLAGFHIRFTGHARLLG